MNEEKNSIVKQSSTIIISIVLGFIIATIFDIVAGFLFGLYMSGADPLYPYSTFLYTAFFSFIFYKSIKKTNQSLLPGQTKANDAGLKMVMGVTIILIVVVAVVFVLGSLGVGYK